MKNKKILVISLLAAFVLAGGGIVSYYWYEGAHYVKTEDARIATDAVSVSAKISGKIVSWDATEGDDVRQGQTLGRQDTELLAGSSAVSAKGLNQTGSVAIERAEIAAPVAGRILKSAVQEGQVVSAGQTLATIANMDEAYLSANIEETKIAKVTVGAEVDFTIDAYPGIKFQGRVESIGQATLSTFSVLSTQNSSGSFTKVTQVVPIKMRFSDEGQHQFLPGMSAKIKIHVGTPPDRQVLVKFAAVAPQIIQGEINVTGIIDFENSTNLNSQLSGTVASVAVVEGQLIKAGEIVLSLDKSELLIQLQQAQTNLTRSEEAANQAKIALDAAQKDLELDEQLFAAGAIAQKEIDLLTVNRDLAQSAFETQNAGVAASRAAIESIRISLAKADIKSPVDGIVASCGVSPGETVTPAVTLVSIISTIDNATLNVLVDESKINCLAAGQPATIESPAMPGQAIPGEIIFVSSVSVATGQFFPVKIKAADPEQALRAGMTATARIHITVNAPLAIPKTAIFVQNGRNYVYRDKDGKAEKVPVTIGLSGEQYTAIAGLELNQQVVSEGLANILEGDYIVP
jgi:RND family efflux transporter MFP subunit